MKYIMKANIEFSAEDIADAFAKLSDYFKTRINLIDDDDADDCLEDSFIELGSIEVTAKREV